MDTAALKEKIRSLDPKAHKALRAALIAKYGYPPDANGGVDSKVGQSVEMFAERFGAALEEINRKYRPGTIVYIKVKHPQLWEKIVTAEDRLSETWLVGNAADFKKALDEWRDLYFQGIKFFHDHEELKPLF